MRVEDVLDTLVVHVNKLVTLLVAVHGGTDSLEKLGQVLHGGFVGLALEVEESQNTLVHDLDSKHTELVKLTDELDETETATLGGSGNVVLIRQEGSLLALALWLLG